MDKVDHFIEDSVDDYRLYLADIDATTLLDREEEIALARRVRNGDKEARALFIESNLRLVLWVIKEYHYESNGLDRLDIINYGNLGLITAVDKYDPDRGQFSTMAVPWIRKEIVLGLKLHGQQFRISIHAWRKINRMDKARARLEQENFAYPTLSQIADEMAKVDEAELICLRRGLVDMRSLDAPVPHDDGETDLHDLVGGWEEASPPSVAEAIAKVKCLDEQERLVLVLMFGLMGSKPMSQANIARCLSTSRSRIGQIKQSALYHLYTKGGSQACSAWSK